MQVTATAKLAKEHTQTPPIWSFKKSKLFSVDYRCVMICSYMDMLLNKNNIEDIRKTYIYINTDTRTHTHNTHKRILPLHQADAGSADGVVEIETEEGAGRPAVGTTALLLAFGILLPLPLGKRSDGGGSGCGRRGGAAGAHGRSSHPRESRGRI